MWVDYLDYLPDSEVAVTGDISVAPFIQSAEHRDSLLLCQPKSLVTWFTDDGKGSLQLPHESRHKRLLRAHGIA